MVVDFAKTEPALYRMADESVKYTVPVSMGGAASLAVFRAEQAGHVARYYLQRAGEVLTEVAGVQMMPAHEFRSLSTSEKPVEDPESSQAARSLAVIRARKAELLKKMSPEKRAAFERITSLREKIGPVDFDVVKALREMRQDG